MKQRRLLPDPTLRAATFSECRRYRYDLTREWGAGPTLNVIGTNPSSADAEIDDPTVRVTMTRAKRLGYGRLVFTNVFAWRATDPNELRRVADPIGPENDEFILRWAREADTVLCAWGQAATMRLRSMKVRRMLAALEVDLFALRTSANGEPWHVLYLPLSETMKPYCRAEPALI